MNDTYTPSCLSELFDDPEILLREEDDFDEAHEEMMEKLEAARAVSPYEPEDDADEYPGEFFDVLD